MSSESIEDNILSVIQNVIPHIPRKAENISSISIKTDSSTALPIYNKVREELSSIEKLAKVVDSSNGKKRMLDVNGGSDAKGNNKDEKTKDETAAVDQKSKKQKKEAPLKSPLLKALKQSVKKEQDRIKEATTDEVENKTVQKGSGVEVNSSEKKKTKKRLSSSSQHNQDEDKDKGKEKVTPSTETEAPSSANKKKKIKVDNNNIGEKGDFIASKKYDGSKKGYVFRKGAKGVGYYIDIKPVPDRMALEALSRSNKSGQNRRESTGKTSRKGHHKGKGRRTSY